MRTLFITIGLLFIVLLVFMIGWRLTWRKAVVGEPEIQAGEQLTLTREALAATENLSAIQAAQTWDILYAQSPGDASIALNRSLNQVLLLDSLVEDANNPGIDSEAKKAVLSKLPAAISAARSVIDDYSAVALTRVTPLWLRTRVDLHEAALLPKPMAKSLRREIVDRLSLAIEGELGEDPQSSLLGGSLIEVLLQMEDPLDGLPEDVIERAAQTIASLSDRHGDNLFFALRAARLNIRAMDEAASTYVRRAAELTCAITPSLTRDARAIGLTPTEMVDQITAAIENQNWATAEQRMTLWFNLLNSTELVKTDRRRASPHPLDRLSFDGLRRLSASAAESSPIPAGQNMFRLDPTAIVDNQAISIVQAVDFDLDLDLDLVTVDDSGRLTLWQNEGDDNWSSAGDVNLDMHPSGVIVADLFLVDSSNQQRLRSKQSKELQHNTFMNLVAYGEEGVRIVRIDGGPLSEKNSGTEKDKLPESRLELVKADSGLETVRAVRAAVAGDLEADGDIDLVFATKADGVRMFVNRGNLTFFEIEGSENRFTLDDPVSSMAIVDLDRDLDLDIVAIHAKSGSVGVIENLLHLQFRARHFTEIPPIDGAKSISVEDIDGNVSWDFIVGGKNSAAIIFSQTADAGAWSIDRIEATDLGSASSALLVADLDNDSWMEAISIGDAANRSIDVSRMGPWGWKEWNSIDSTTTASQEAEQEELSFICGDFDGNGSIDLAGVVDSQATILNNQTEGIGHFLDVRFKGIDDNVSGRVNHYAIGSVLELRFGPHYRSRVVTSPSTHFGLGSEGVGGSESVSLRAILPNGLTQTISNPDLDSLVEEQQTLKGSCPYLYAWDGSKYQFVTDCLWAAPLGLQVADGIVAKDRPWEYLKIDGRNIRPKGDEYEFVVTEELWEVAYFDKIALTAVDHPNDVEVWTNEKVGPDSIATPTLFAFRDSDRRPLQQAFDSSSRDVTQKLVNADRDFVQGFDRRLRQGLCPPHWIDLSFANVDDPDEELGEDPNEDPCSVYLVLTGWILPTDTSLNIQIDQNPDLAAIEFPSVWVPDEKAEDGWRMAIPFMGFPGGKTKTIVVDVSDVVDRKDPQLRVRTSAQIYWDKAELIAQSSPAPFVEQASTLTAASVGRHGFSRIINDGPTRPDIYDYQNATVEPRWPPLRGKVTRFGDCIDRLRQWDDRMVVIGAGDEIRLSFTIPDTPIPDGWTRDFVMHNVGWDKDADLNTLAGQMIGPLPYRSMTQYPPPVEEASQTEARDKLNRDHLQRTQSFRSFWSRQPHTVQTD